MRGTRRFLSFALEMASFHKFKDGGARRKELQQVSLLLRSRLIPFGVVKLVGTLILCATSGELDTLAAIELARDICMSIHRSTPEHPVGQCFILTEDAASHQHGVISRHILDQTRSHPNPDTTCLARCFLSVIWPAINNPCT